MLANDRDPDGDQMRIVVTTHPVHGSADCSELGACLCTADEGYAGSDEFAYTVSDTDGGKSSATVRVSVSPPPSGARPLTVQDDDVATRAGTPVEIAVLDNDAGAAPLGVTATGTPSHGAAACTTAGRCTYEPEPGFSGADGFTYDVQDAASASATGAVHVTVAAPQTGLRTAHRRRHGETFLVIAGSGSEYRSAPGAARRRWSVQRLRRAGSPLGLAAM